jgi:4-carboxymuconolactone decarboxylase
VPDDEQAHRRERGLAVYRQVYGDDAVTFPPGEAAFFDLMVEQLFGEVWSRPALTIPVRRLLTIGVLAAQHRFPTVQLQFERALRQGELTVEQVREVVVHLVPYVGYPVSGDLYGAGEAAIEAVAADPPPAGA